VLGSAAIGQFVEWYDFVIYAYTASVIATLFFPTDDRVASLLATFAVYAVGFIMRPLGGIVLGHLGDKIGRRSILATVILLMGGSTAAIGLLPTYEQIGVLAPILLVICRLLQGASAGAETAGSNSLVAEHSPQNRRGFYVSFTYAFANLPAVFAALFVLLLTNTMGAELFSEWGWRIPFIVGGLFALVGLYIRMKVDETPAFVAARANNQVAKFPLLAALRDHPKQIFFAFALAALSGLGFYTLTGYFTTYLKEAVGLSANDALISNSIALFAAFIVMPLAGWASDRIGRRPMILIGTIASAVASVPAYALASSGSLITAILGQTLLAVALSIFFGPFGVAFLEIFPPRVRFSGGAFGYNAAYVIFGGTAPFFSIWLVDVTGNLLAPAFYMAIVAIIVTFVALRLPEGSAISDETHAAEESRV
jgi:MHS family proline/betaine transporter-like MFS transporter